MSGVREAVSSSYLDREANDELLRGVKSQLPSYVSQVGVYALDGTNIGSSASTEVGRVDVKDRAYFLRVLEGQRLSIGDVIVGRLSNLSLVNFAPPLHDLPLPFTPPPLLGTCPA